MSIALTRAQSRRVDQFAIEQLGLAGAVLMENAGRGVVDALLRTDPTLAAPNPTPTTRSRGRADRRPCPFVGILTGKGNNAGDGFVIARHLAIRGVETVTLLLAPPSELEGDAALNYRALNNLDAEVVDISSARDFDAALNQQASDASWLVDAMLGTGAQGAPRPPIDEAIRWMNRQAARRLAVDVPSGMDCDTGDAEDPTVRADLTCTFVAAKCGFLQPAAAGYLGQLEVLDIGVPASVIVERLSLAD